MAGKPDPEREGGSGPGPAPGSTIGSAPSGSSKAPRASGSQAGRARRATFAAPQLVAGRYRIVRFIAQGGMGEVYEAEDTELPGEHVALKTVRSDVAEDDTAVARFKREVQLARRVTHPNVCRIFEMGHHVVPAEPGSAEPPVDVLFLTMEMLEGETLRDRIRRAGPLPTADALKIARQLALALDTAHEAGIVHRDFKSANVLLVAGRGRERAVVTDFGLARTARDVGSDGHSLTGTGMMVGTPAYMAPEQAQGKDSGPAQDVHALGVVLFEMVTGRLPFESDNPLAIILKRIQEEAPSPRTFVPDLDAAWEQVIVRCLARDPAQRFATAGEAVAALSPQPISVSQAAFTPLDASGAVALPPPPAAGRGRRLTVGALVAAALALGALFAWRQRAVPPPASSPALEAAAPIRRSVAVVGLRNLGQPPAAWMATALTEMIRTELGTGGLRTIGGTEVARMKQELGIEEADTLPRDVLARVRENIAADLVVVGSYVALGASGAAQVRIDVRVQDAQSGEVTAVGAASGAEADLFGLVAGLGRDLRQRLGIEPKDAPPPAAPASAAALRLYAEGLDRLRHYDAIGARDRLQEAVKLDPASPRLRAALASAWVMLGYDARAQEEARLASTLPATVGREERLGLEALQHETAGAWDRAVSVYQTLWREFPDELDHALRLAAAQTAAGQPRAAQETLGAARRLPPPLRDDPRLDLEAATAARALTDWGAMRTAAARAAARTKAQGARLLYARARLLEGIALINAGEGDEGIPLCEEARGAFAEAGDLRQVARSLNSMAVAHAMREDFAGARNRLQEALRVSREIGDQKSIALQLDNLANVEGELGNPKEARLLYEQVIVIAQDTGDRTALARTLNNLGVTLLDLGDLPAARKAYDRALATWTEMGATAHMAVTHWNIAELIGKQGRPAEALDEYGVALGLFRRTDRKADVAETLALMAALRIRLGQPQEAAADLQAARAIYAELADRPAEVRTLRAAADLARQRGDRAGAGKLYDEAARIEREAGLIGTP